MIFSQLQNAVPDAFAEGTKVTGLGLQGHIGHFVNHAIEGLFEKGQNLSFPPPILIGGYHIVFGIFFQEINHFPDDFRPLLQIGINQADVIPLGVLEPGVESRFLAEVAGEGHHLHRAALLLIELAQIVERGIGAAVVHKDDLKGIAAALEGLDGLLLEKLYIFCFIKAGHNQRELQKNSTPVFRMLPLYFILPIRQGKLPGIYRSFAFPISQNFWKISIDKTGDLL